MRNIKKLKLSLQRADGLVVTNTKQQGAASLENLFSKPVDSFESQYKLSGSPGEKADGYFIIMQDWSQCSKKCGTGVSTYHRMCMPPRNGGKPCEGDAILTKPCNKQPCPKVSGQGEKTTDKDNITLKPIVKVLPYSSRPQRYHKCIIKEGDLMMTKEMETNSNKKDQKTTPVQVPVRVIMNNRTLTAYENAEDFTSHYITYNLLTADFGRSPRDKYCFVISEGTKRTELCPFGFAKTLKAYNDWDKEFHTFKLFCETKPNEVASQFALSLLNKINDAKRAVLGEQEEDVKKTLRKKEFDNNFEVIKKTNQVVQKAIIKEQDLEALIEKEEAEKEVNDEQVILQAINAEQKKNVIFYY